MINILTLSLFLAIENNQKCNNYFCYSYDESKKGWELEGLAENYQFQSYGETHSDPLTINPGFKDDNSPLISIKCRFPSSNYPMELIIPETIQYIAPRAFYQVNNVKMNITFGDNIIIENNDFQDCTGLISIQFKGNCKKLGENSFQDCFNLVKITTIEVEKISDYAFMYCTNLSCELEISPKTKKIGKFSFSNCFNLIGGLKFPDSVTFIGENSF